MQRLALLGAAAVLLTFVPSPAPAQVVPGAPGTDWEREHAAYNAVVLRSYNALINDWREALLEKDAQRASEQYAENARLLVSGHVEVVGRDSIESFLSRFMVPLVDVRTSLAEFMASDRLAFATGPLIYNHRGAADGLARMEVGTHVTVLVREGRHWRIRSQVIKYEGETLGSY